MRVWVRGWLIVLGLAFSAAAAIYPAVGRGWQAGTFHGLRNLAVGVSSIIGHNVVDLSGSPKEESGFKRLPEYGLPSHRPLEHNTLPVSYRKFHQIIQIGVTAVRITPEFFAPRWIKRPPLNFASRVKWNIGGNNIYVSQRDIAFHFDPFGRGLSGVFNVDVESTAKGLGVHISPFDGEVSPGLGAPHIARYLDRFFGGLSGGPTGFQGSPDERYPGRGYEHFQQANPEHSPSPFRYVVLGAEIIGGLLLFVGGWLLIIRGFERAGDALDVVLDGNRKAWLCGGFCFFAALFGGGVSAGIVTYALSLYGNRQDQSDSRNDW
jgi:hypothetical protein